MLQTNKLALNNMLHKILLTLNGSSLGIILHLTVHNTHYEQLYLQRLETILSLGM